MLFRLQINVHMSMLPINITSPSPLSVLVLKALSVNPFGCIRNKPRVVLRTDYVEVTEVQSLKKKCQYFLYSREGTNK